MAQGKKKRTKKSIILLLSALMFMATGCGEKALSDDVIKEFIVSALETKYGGEFEIVSLEKENTGQEFKHYRFKATVKSMEYGDTFEAYVSLKGKDYFDTHEKALYSQQIENEVNSVAFDGADVRVKDIHFLYEGTGDEAAKSCEDYVKQGNVSINIDVYLDGNDPEAVTDSLNSYMQKLESMGYSFSVCIDGGKKRRIINVGKDKKVDRDTIHSKVLSALGDE
ncbi:hypothetical protein [Butyrivibrio sp. NC2002]|uniref:hypothetical protein n=1 Tax=Butyrivibrio sp. NC2002 TaxID=1410610 RepID=UPI00056A763F|nr:hypothetical protein [Butyrivibrio sp. NC2002]